MSDIELHLSTFQAVDWAGVEVDCIMADAPYERHMHDAKSGKRGIRIDGAADPEALDFECIDEPTRKALCELAKAICNGWFLVFCTPEGVAAWRDAIEAAGLKYKRALPWVKPDSAPQFNGQGPAGCTEMICAAWCGTGFSKWNDGGARGEYRIPVNPSDRDGRHPTEKPQQLMRKMIWQFTQPGQIILDPFMGGGSTGVAAKALDRRFIGVEAQPHHFATAEDRLHIAATASGEDLGPLFATAGGIECST